jgi:LmbE family N-acetylglucosaminyl deacetylase
MRVLVVAAHPDDEVLGAGATIARLAATNEVFIAIMAEGATSRVDQRDLANRAHVAALETQAHRAGAILGAKSVDLFGFPDNRMDTVALLDVVKVVEQLVIKHRPDVIYTHHVSDLNVDHQTVARAVLTATRPMAGHCVREIYAFEVPSSTEWGFQMIEPVFRANSFVDVTETIDVKVRALLEYESEARPFPHPRSPEALHAIARRWGSVVGCGAAEAFQLVRAIR